MKLVIGLGNPGKQYQKTRHNVGFMVLGKLRDEFSDNTAFSPWELSKKFNAEVCGATVKGEKIILAKPMTFMNTSGQAVQLLMHFYHILPEDLVVVHDDKDLPLSTVKVQTDRGHAGHNGVRSIIEHLGSQKFTRIRVGIASDDPKKMSDISEFVLNKFSLFERKELARTIAKAVEEIKKCID